MARRHPSDADFASGAWRLLRAVQRREAYSELAAQVRALAAPEFVMVLAPGDLPGEYVAVGDGAVPEGLGVQNGA